MRIIGLDPGTAITGFSIIHQERGKTHLLDYGCIRTPAGTPHPERLTQISADLQTIIDRYKPQHASIEKIFFQKNVKTAITVAQARGVLLEKLHSNQINIKEFTPLEIKSSVTGYGKADKKMIQQMIKMTFNLKEIPKPDDAADAVAAALCLANSLKFLNKAYA